MKTIIALGGASGSVFGVEFVKACPGTKYLTASKWGKMVLHQETGLRMEDLAGHVKTVFPDEDLSCALASGSNAIDAMVVVPCSASTLAKIACGIADSLTTRAAMVMLKERRKLIIALRETPLSTITLEQMHKLSLAGAIIMPISPGLYNGAQNLTDMAREFAGRIVQIIDPAAQSLHKNWKAEQL